MSQPAHLRYGGSNIGRVMLCRASAKLSEQAPVLPPDQWAREGTAAHKLLERAIKEGLADVSFLIGLDDTITEDMANGVNMALEAVRDAFELASVAPVVIPETFVRFPGFEPIAGGTVDIQLVSMSKDDPDEIIDFKYGFDPVEADAPQLLYYAVSAYGVENPVRCTVVQPRAFHADGPVRSVDVDAARLRAFYQAAASAIEEAEADLAPFNPSPKACHHCPAAMMCPALEAEALSLPALRNVRELARQGRQALPAPETLGLDRAAYVMQMRPMLIHWLDAVEEYAFAEAMSGAVIPGFKLAESNRKRTWPDDRTTFQTAQVLAHASGLPADEFMRQGLVTITDAQKKVSDALRDTGVKEKQAKKLAKDVLAFIVERKRSDQLTLVPQDDPRPAVNRAARDFAGVQVSLPKG